MGGRIARRGPAILAAALLVAAGQSGALARGQSQGQQRVAAVRRLVQELDTHQLGAATRLFTPSAILRVSRRKWRGSRAVSGWWRREIAGGLRLSLVSPIHLSGSDAQAVLRLTARVTCPTGCWERTTWRFSGVRFTLMTLQPMPRPPLPQPEPGGKIPPPPNAPPPPGVTPTIPT